MVVGRFNPPSDSSTRVVEFESGGEFSDCCATAGLKAVAGAAPRISLSGTPVTLKRDVEGVEDFSPTES